MRIVFAAIFTLIGLSLLAPPAVLTAVAQEACRCKGCGCKGGPGWRGPEGTCVSQAKLAQICGSPPGAPCVRETATRVCYGDRSAAKATQTPAETN
ncbi:MAG TPA: hypothetical protein VNJ31_09395 [Methyloceanibacter sp.]|nr:hypothetical protein [Methyloceanibacter sp.]